MSITKISPSVVDFDAGITISTADNLDTLTLTSTDADANAGPNLRMYRNSSSPADADVLGVIDYEGRNDNSQDVVYASITAQANDVSDGSEDGSYYLSTMVGGTLRNRMNVLESETVFNQESLDLDFRVEGDGNTHALFVQASDDKVGIGVSDPGGLPLHLKVASGDNKLRQETAAKDAFTLGLDNSTGDTIIGTHALYPAVRFLNAGGIAFGSDTAAANALDDYEEGTFTPTLYGYNGNTISVSGTFSGYYTKIGRLVNIILYAEQITFDSGVSSNYIQISLPFSAHGGSNMLTNSYGVGSFTSTLMDFDHEHAKPSFITTTTIGFLGSNQDGGAWGWETWATAGTNAYWRISMTYMTA